MKTHKNLHHSIAHMKCPLCGAVVHAEPEKFLGEFTCPNCHHDGYFVNTDVVASAPVAKRPPPDKSAQKQKVEIMSTPVNKMSLYFLAGLVLLLIAVAFIATDWHQGAVMSAGEQARITAHEEIYRGRLIEALALKDASEIQKALMSLRANTPAEFSGIKQEIDNALIESLLKSQSLHEELNAEQEQRIMNLEKKSEEMLEQSSMLENALEMREEELLLREGRAEGILSRETKVIEQQKELSERAIELQQMQDRLEVLGSDITAQEIKMQQRDKELLSQEKKLNESWQALVDKEVEVKEAQTPPAPQVIVVQPPVVPSSSTRMIIRESYPVYYGNWYYHSGGYPRYWHKRRHHPYKPYPQPYHYPSYRGKNGSSFGFRLNISK